MENQVQLFSKMFEEKNVEILTLNDEILFNARNIGGILGIVEIRSTLRVFNGVHKRLVTNDLISSYATGHSMHIRKIHNAGETFLTEAGLYKLIFISRKPNAEKFQDWVLGELLPEIRKSGHYIADDLTSEQETKLVDAVTAKFSHKILGNVRLESTNIVREYLEGYGYTRKQTNTLISSIHNHCHVATTAMTATKFIATKIEEGLHEVDTILKQDYRHAINYYSERELNLFGCLFDIIMDSAVAHIRNERVKCTPQKVKDAITKESIGVVREYSGLEAGTKLQAYGLSLPDIMNIKE